MSRLSAPACKYLVRMMVMMAVMVMTAAMIAMLMMMVMTTAMIVMLMMMVVAAAVTAMLMVVPVTAVFILLMMFFQKFPDLCPVFQRAKDGFSSQLFPRRRNHCRILVFLPKHVDTLFNLFICHQLRPADDNGRSMSYLVLIELSEILKI